MLEIQKKFIKYNTSARVGEPIKYIVTHDVGVKGSTAQNNRDYFNTGDRQSSADFFVDANNIIQCVDYNSNYSWAVGDGAGRYGILNKNSISIEMCLVEPFDAVIKNTIDLVKYLMVELNIPTERVVRHYDASRKNCPNSFSANNWAKWNWFKEQLVVPIISKTKEQDINDNIWELSQRKIISDVDKWLKRCMDNEDDYWLTKKVVAYLKSKGV